MEYILSVK